MNTPEDAVNIIDKFVQLILDIPKNILINTWNSFNNFLTLNWQVILFVILFLIAIATLKYLFTKRWGTLGSLLYNLFYFGIMFMVINKLGPEIILEDFFKIISFLAYVLGFFLTRIILNATGISNLPKFNI